MLGSLLLAASIARSMPHPAIALARVPTLRDTSELEALVRTVARPIAPRDIVLETIAIVGKRAIVDWDAQRMHGAISGGGAILARERAGTWSLIGTSSNYFSLRTLQRTDPRLSRLEARSFLAQYRVGVMLRACGANAQCPTTRGRITAVVVRDALDKSGFGIAPTVWPIARAGNFALVDWTEGEGGGEAFLRFEHGRWRITVMGGGSMASVDMIAPAGPMSQAMAQRLVHEIVAGEDAPDLPCSPANRCAQRERQVRVVLSRYERDQSRSALHLTFRAVCVAGDFALVDYSVGSGSGQALLHLSAGSWHVLADGPEWIADSGLLVRSFGLDPADAMRIERQIIDAGERGFAPKARRPERAANSAREPRGRDRRDKPTQRRLT